MKVEDQETDVLVNMVVDAAWYAKETIKAVKAELHKRSLENDTKLMSIPKVHHAWYLDQDELIGDTYYGNECKCEARHLFNFGHEATCKAKGNQ